MSEIEELREMVEKVRNLHVPVRMYTDNHSTEWHWECAECADDSYPCATAKTLGES